MEIKAWVATVVLPSVIAFTSKPTSSLGSQWSLFHLKNELKVDRVPSFCDCWDRAGKDEQVGPGGRRGCGSPIQLTSSFVPDFSRFPAPGWGLGEVGGLGSSRWSFIALILGGGRPGCRLARTEVKGFPFLLAVNWAG